MVVCGGPLFEAQAPPDIAERLEAAHEKDCVIVGICGGTVALAGLVDHVPHTSNSPGYLEKHAPRYSGLTQYVEQPKAMRAERVITAPAAAPASFAAEVLAASGLSPENVDMIRTMLAAEHQS